MLKPTECRARSLDNWVDILSKWLYKDFSFKSSNLKYYLSYLDGKHEQVNQKNQHH